ncbi:hypothetical protein [Streptomyces canus]|uniref:hypothetical protein n=1 Tax=Streptomyces canus TaxID=58343 RepID=UPI002E32A535|nr:hypothetical protein [Streptomyces canus]
MQQPDARKKTINPSAYNALADALTVIFWNKPPFERYVRGMLQDHSELLTRLNFGAPKDLPGNKSWLSAAGIVGLVWGDRRGSRPSWPRSSRRCCRTWTSVSVGWP